MTVTWDLNSTKALTSLRWFIKEGKCDVVLVVNEVLGGVGELGTVWNHRIPVRCRCDSIRVIYSTELFCCTLLTRHWLLSLSTFTLSNWRRSDSYRTPVPFPFMIGHKVHVMLWGCANLPSSYKRTFKNGGFTFCAFTLVFTYSSQQKHTARGRSQTKFEMHRTWRRVNVPFTAICVFRI